VKHPGVRAVSDFLPDAIPGLHDRLLEDRIRRAWPALVGPEIARRARPERLVGDCLHVTVDNSPWLHELTLRATEIGERVARRFAAVSSVRFGLGRLPSEAPPPGTPAAPRPRPLDPEEVRAIDEAVSAIPDPALRATARRVLTTARRAATADGPPR
jgi:hypothetical protein